ncbi:MAG: hypothetical protein EOP04_12650 [Proteobacteria bacterium]|nr:MAG: hypothetical protein EOP04_12650 [Pseudomonadota bacterium]
MIKAKATSDPLFLGLDDVRFEILRALTRTARDAVNQIKSDLPRKFVLRKSWVTKGIRFSPASKADPIARVYSVDPWMEKQEEGEQYRPQGRSVAIPGRGVRASKTAVIPAALFPRQLKARKDVFRADLKGIGTGLFQHQKKGLKILYLLRERKTTMAAWDFKKTVEKTVEKRFDDNFK